MRMRRYLETVVGDALKRKMVLVGGPRQVGKTTFALGFLGKDADEQHPGYLNWDHPRVPPVLKYCHWVEDTEGYSMELRYLRDTDGREVDFVVLKNRKPQFAVECKTGDKDVSAAAVYFSERTPIPHFYQTHLGARSFSKGNLTVLPFPQLCEQLELP